MIIALASFVIPDAQKTVLSFFSARIFLLAQLSTVTGILHSPGYLGFSFEPFYTGNEEKTKYLILILNEVVTIYQNIIEV